jgi:cell wall-associated NlpC family hydrolase
VRALGLRAAERALDRLADRRGDRFATPKLFGALVLGDQLYLHYNHLAPEEGPELRPITPVTRADAAFALDAAVDASSSWLLPSMSRYTTIELPRMSDRRRAVVEFALRWTGWPYVYGGEWHRPTPDGYCCGAQTVGGFDCSGFVWWTLRRGDSLYDNTHLRPYRGWRVDERTASTQAAAADVRIGLADLRPGDIVFFDTDGAGSGWRSIDHSGIALGNGWMIHSSGGRAGVTIDQIDAGWWRGTYKWGRRVIGT